MSPFVNEPLLEIRREETRAQLRAALAAVDAQLPRAVSATIGERDVRRDTFDSVDPSSPERRVAVAHRSTARDAADAVTEAVKGQRPWAAKTMEQRSATVSRAAGLLRARRLELAALAVREAGKPWHEADADVCEAIDFMEYYARQALTLDVGGEVTQLPGERNRLRYVARGVTAVIAPWNFPFAIATGLTVGPLVAGNAVVLKPAEQAPACAAAVVEALHAAGVPRTALSFLPGGDEPGRALVADPRVHAIAFTGSCAVGQAIIRQAAEVAEGQSHIKRVVAEMGGKNCIIVDGDADLDDAVPAVIRSAFGFAGQKCSAASRVLVHERIADRFAERLAGAIATLEVGPAERFGIDVPPVIDAEAEQRIEELLEAAPAGARLAAAESMPTRAGYYVRPTAFYGLGADSPIVREEVFGPVLSVEAVRDVAEACEIVDRGSFALTGGLFSRSPRTIDEVIERSPVGNLYINREITGAMVGRQPFGGGRLSGTGPKAGGPDFLLAFLEARSVTENTVRHGLVV